MQASCVDRFLPGKDPLKVRRGALQNPPDAAMFHSFCGEVPDTDSLADSELVDAAGPSGRVDEGSRLETRTDLRAELFESVLIPFGTLLRRSSKPCQLISRVSQG